MAERVLPSREAATLAIEGFRERNEWTPILVEIAEFFVSGRLVDREAIDHERVEEILDELCRDWYDMVIREGKVFDFGAAIRALDAALEDV